jgi:hypothetical protein
MTDLHCTHLGSDTYGEVPCSASETSETPWVPMLLKVQRCRKLNEARPLPGSHTTMQVSRSPGIHAGGESHGHPNQGAHE